MCCDVCPHYTNCEEEGNLGEVCCTTCPDYHVCYKGDEAKDKDAAESENEPE